MLNFVRKIWNQIFNSNQTVVETPKESSFDESFAEACAALSEPSNTSWAKEWYDDDKAMSELSREEAKTLRGLIKQAGIKDIEYQLIGVVGEMPLYRVKYMYSSSSKRSFPTVLYKDVPARTAASAIFKVAKEIADVLSIIDMPFMQEETKKPDLKPTKKVVKNASNANS